MYSTISRFLRSVVFLGFLSTSIGPQAYSQDDILIADFESDSYAPWKTTGNAFGPSPARGTLPSQMLVDGFVGEGLVNSYLGGDAATGTLESPVFRLERNYIAYSIGGGLDRDRLALQLLLDGKVIRSSTGPNHSPGGSERLARDAWEVSEFIGKMVSIRIIDEASGGWGHINVDHLVQTNRKPPGIQSDVKRLFQASGRYLNIPIKNGAPKRMVTLLVDGKKVVRNEIELADGQADWWAPMEIQSWRGAQLTLVVDKLAEDSKALDQIEVSDTVRESSDLYREALRPQFHFSPKRGWNNDPNGMVYFRGEYHLFFQHNPYGWGWGNMHWGHAVSRDLVHWEELGDKLLPDDLGPMFSGSAVVDWSNTSGLGSVENPPMVLLYTAAGNPTVQCLAYSTDGRTFTKYPGNPVVLQVTGGNRDPKVIWHEASKKWIMVLYVEKPAGLHTVHFFTSTNLIQWELASVTEGDPAGKRYLFECPDFFPLAVRSDAKQTRWVLLGADSQYATGSFDGKTFQPEQDRIPGQRGLGFYAPQTFSDIPESDGRRIQMGWFQTETKGMPFNQSMTVPLELQLKQTDQGIRMTFQPVQELQSLRRKSHQKTNVTIPAAGSTQPLRDLNAELFELRTTLSIDQACKKIEFQLRGLPVVYENASQTLVVKGHRVSLPLRSGKLDLIVYGDRTGVEIFADGGLVYIPLPHNFDAGRKDFTVQADGGRSTIDTLEFYELQSIWEPQS